MKTTIKIIFLALFFCANAVAQWRVIYPNEKYNFLKNNQSDSIIRTTLWVDSARQVNNDSIYYLNRVFKPLGNNGTYCLINQGLFLKKSITILANNVQQINGDTLWYINGNCSIGESWLFDSISNKTAICDTAFLMNIFGNTDSVKRILINLTDTILLSKNYGLVSFPDFALSPSYYKLVGLQNSNLGLRVPTSIDFCNFNIGDEFEYYSHSTSTTTIAHPYQVTTISTSTYSRYIIQSKVITSDSITYQIFGKRRVNGTIDSAWSSTLVYHLNDSNEVTNSYYNQYHLGLWTVFLNSVKPDVSGKYYEKTTYNNCASIFPNSDSIYVGCGGFPWSNTYQRLYRQNIGLINETSSNSSSGNQYSSGSSNSNLVAYNINGVQYGNFLPDSTYTACWLDTILSNNYIETDDDSLSAKDTLVMWTHYPAASYSWSTGETTDSIQVSTAGSYTVKITNVNGCTKSLNIKTIAHKNRIIAPSLFMCDSSNVTLSSAMSNLKYLWSNGSTRKSITVLTPGQYCLTTTDTYGYHSTKCVTVSNINRVPLNWLTDTVLTYSGSMKLSLPSLYDTFLWNDGDTLFEKIADANNLKYGINKIWVEASKNGCAVSDTIYIIRNPQEEDLENNFNAFFTVDNSSLVLLPTTYPCTYQLFSMDGMPIFNEQKSNGNSTLVYTLESLNSGIYILRITTSKKSFSGKIMIRH